MCGYLYCRITGPEFRRSDGGITLRTLSAHDQRVRTARAPPVHDAAVWGTRESVG